MNRKFTWALSVSCAGAFLLLAANPLRAQSSSPPSGLLASLPPSTQPAIAASALPSAPDPSSADHPVEPFPTNFWYPPYSRIGIGVDISPFGIGIKGALLLNTVFDARLMQNFFSYDSGRFELSNVNVDANLHFRSTAAAFDWYPFRSVWRFSAGALFLNSNQITAGTRIASGSSIKLNGETFWSANPNAATGAVPLTGSGVIGFHAHNPAITLSGGFGRFIPRSERHWSFPSEFGVAFTGPPTIDVNLAGWACLDEKQTQCASVSNPNSPVAIQFNHAVQSRIDKFRQSVSGVQIYPIFSYSAVYSFNIRQR